MPDFSSVIPKVSSPSTKNVPFFLAILGGPTLASLSFITMKTIPASVSDTKEINWSEIQIPGGHTSSSRFGSFGANNITFNLKVADFNDRLGVTSLTSALSNLRRPTRSRKSGINFTSNKYGIPTKYTGTNEITGVSPFVPFTPPPNVILWHSLVANIPLEYEVKKCDFDTSLPNRWGRPQVVTISFSFTLVEDGLLYQMEVLAAQVAGIANMVKNLKRLTSNSNPYKKGLII